jgi:nickel-type superoxide dismutase maturation protease
LWLVLWLGCAAAALAFAGRARRRYTRWEVSGTSMSPTLQPGDWLIVERAHGGGRPVRSGDIVLAPDPREGARTLVKRVARCDGNGQAWIAGDNPAESTDSRHFGPVPVDHISARVRWRYWPLRRVGRVR